MNKLIGLVIKDILKNKVILVYTLFLAAFGWSVFSLESSSSKGVLSLLNIILLSVPLVSIIFANIYIYNSKEFIELLVSQPIKRSTIWNSIFLGLLIAINLAFLVGIGLPVLIFSPNMIGFSVVVTGLFVGSIFTSLAMMSSILAKDKARGIGLSIMIWLFLTLIYDGLLLFFMFQFSEYPIEKPMVIFSAINPIDLARIQMLLQIDVSALMGYTGAIFKMFFGNFYGYIITIGLLFVWVIVPYLISLRKFNKKDL